MDGALHQDQSSQHQNQDYYYYGDNCEENNDSDVEAKLYAEIYYSNNIVGENNQIDKLIKDNNVLTQSSQATDTAVRQKVSIDCDNKDQHNLSDDNLSSQSNILSLTVNNIAKNICSTSIFEDEVIVNSGSTQIIQDKNLLVEPKRSLEYDSRCNNQKKKKQENDYSSDIIRCEQNDAQNLLINNTNCQKSIIVNSSNKQIENNLTNARKLLSPKVSNLFCSKKTKNQKNFNKSSNNKLIERFTSDKTCKNDNVEPFLNKQNTNRMIDEKNKKSENISNDTSVIIDISSESSEDFSNENSKYDTVEAAKKKFKKSFDCNNDSNSYLSDSSSDSDESIFEIPLPPKPVPILIDLKDSDSDGDNDIDNNNSDNYTNNISICQIDQNEDEQSKNKTTNNNNLKKKAESNFILNCTEVSKGANDLHEIRTMSRETSSLTVQSNQVDNIQQNINDIQSTSQQSNIDLNKRNRQNKKNRSSNPVIYNASSNSDRQSTVEINQNKESVLPKDDFFQPMNKKMKDFYDKSWGGESFDMEKLKSTMTSDPRKWAILDDDIVGIHPQRNKRYFGMFCNYCGKNGHKTNQCIDAYKKPTCHMCGIIGHFETSCPQKKCLTCGRMQHMYSKTCESCYKMLCSRCHSRGHLETTCPDLWRRFHNIVSRHYVEIPNNSRQIMKPQRELFCCNCAKKGHDFNSCKKLQWSQHFSTPSHVINYEGPSYYSENLPKTNIIYNKKANKDLCNLNFTNNDTSNVSSTNSEKFSSRKLKAKASNSSRQQRMEVENEKNIFEIKSNHFDKTQKMHRCKLNLGECGDNKPIHKLENWNPLIRFLNALVSDVQGTFVLQQKKKNFFFLIYCLKKNSSILAKLLKQYISRNNNQRPRMYLEWERNPIKLVKQFKCKIAEMNALNEDPLKLYQEFRQLHLKTHNPMYGTISAQELSRLTTVEEKLLITLFKEKCADNSLNKLKKLTSIYSGNYLKKSEEKSAKNELSVELQWLYEYLYLYNKIFTPHNRNELGYFIAKYRKNMLSRRNLKHNINPMFSMQEKNVASQSDIHNHHYSSNYGIESSMSQVLPTLTAGNSSSTLQTTSSLVNSTTKNNLSISSKNVSFQSNPKLISNNGRIRKNKLNKMQKLMKYVRRLLKIAENLNAPHLKGHIETLNNKLKNNTLMNRNDTKILQALVQREKNKHRDKKAG